MERSRFSRIKKYGWIALILLFAASFLIKGYTFVLIDRSTQKIILKERVKPMDQLCLQLEHSFEHVDWFEYYTINEDTTFTLDMIQVEGYGAGIPAEMDVETVVEDGYIWMKNIQSQFPYFQWITSDQYMKTLTLNNRVIFDFRTLENQSKIRAEIRILRGIFLLWG